MKIESSSGANGLVIENFNTIKNLIPSGVFTVDNDLNITSWNRQAEIITGYTESEILGKSCLTFAIEPCKEACGLKDNHVIKPILNRECRILTKDQRIVPILKNVDVLTDEKGNIIGGIESFISIEERVKFENKYKEQNAFLESIYKGSDSCLFVIDVDENKDFRFVGLNPAHEKLTGMRTEEIYGKTPLELDPIIPLEAGKHINQHYQDCYNAGKTIEYEEVIPIKGKDWYWLTKLTPLKNSEGEIYRIIGSATSINQLKEAHQELEIYKNNLEDLVKEKTEELKQQLEGNERVTEDLRVSNEELTLQNQERSALEEELRTNNDELLFEIEKRNETEKKLRQSEFEIGERLKETQCLHDIDVAATEEETAEGLFSKVIEIIPSGLLKPDVTGVQIKYDNLKFESKNYRTDAELLKENIIVHGKNRGQILVSYGEKTKKNPFLKEEAELLKSIRKRVCVSLEKRIENRRREHILNNAFDGFRINDIDGNIIEANVEYCKMLGYSKKELLGMTVQEIDSGRDGADVNQLMHKVIKEKFLKYTDRQRRKDGRLIEVMNNASYFEEDELFYVFIEDLSKINKLNQELQQQITEKTAIEEELRASNEELEQEIVERRMVEKELQKTNIDLKTIQERLKLSLKHNNATVFEDNLKTGEMIITPELFYHIGYRDENIPRTIDSFIEIIHPDDVPAVIEALNRHIEGKDKQYFVEYRIKDAKGNWNWIDGLGEITKWDDDGNAEILIGISRDIHERKTIENELKEREYLYKITTEATNLGVWDWKVNTNEVFYSEVWKAQLGYKPNEIKNEFASWSALLHPEDFERSHKAVQDYLANPEGPFLLTFRMKHKDGSYRWLQNHAHSFKDENGHVARMYGVHTDITKQKQSEQKLIDSEQRFRDIFDHSPLGKSITTLDGKLQTNNGFTDILGYSYKELQDIPFADITHPEDLEKSNKIVKDLLDGKMEFANFEKRYLHKDGHYVWTDVNVTLHKNSSGKPLFFITSISDISERKLADQKLHEAMKNLERSNKELEDFAYIASHDLQEPLRVVGSYVSLLSRRYKESLDKDAFEFIDFVEKGVSRMQNMIDDILDYSRVTTRGREFKKYDPTESVNIALQNLKYKIGKSNARISVEKLPKIKADEQQIVNLFQNLISNAIKYSKPKIQPEIKVLGRKEKGNVILSVSDNGIGIKKVYQEKVFKIFHQLHAKTKYQGSGIGLAICKKIVERHDGEIWFESEIGEGTTFFIKFPAK